MLYAGPLDQPLWFIANDWILFPFCADLNELWDPWGGSQVDVPMGDKHPNWGISPNACENEEDSTEIHFGENLVTPSVTMYNGDFLSMGTTCFLLDTETIWVKWK